MSDPNLTSSTFTQSVNLISDTSTNAHQPKSKNNHFNKEGYETESCATKDTSESGEKTNSSSNIASDSHASERRDTTTTSSRASELANLKVRLRAALRQFPDFPSPGILFEDILPIFADPSLHRALLRALEYSVEDVCAGTTATANATTTGSGSASASALASSASKDEPSKRFEPDVIVGLEARGFLFGPALALHLGAAFVPVRKKGKLPGRTFSASYVKEYGEDVFEMQQDVIKPGQRVLIVDDIIATGGSAAAAGSLVRQSGGNLVAYIFMMELDFLKGRTKLDAPVLTLLSGQPIAEDEDEDASASASAAT